MLDHAGAVPAIGLRNRLETPCLLVDLGVLEQNIARMAQMCRSAGMALRPHAKAHKCAAIGHLQMEAGARGLCVATVGEAEALVAAGLTDLHVTSTLASPDKVARLGALMAQGARVSGVVDCAEMVDLFSVTASRLGLVIPLLIDVDMGRHRAGLSDVAEARTLGMRIAACPGLRLAGIQAYAGHLSHMRDHRDRLGGAQAAAQLIASMRAALEDLVAGPFVVTGGSTGTVMVDLEMGVFTELQVGSYVFMDTEYGCVDLDGHNSTLFEPALFLQTAVISNRHAGFVTTDGGDKRLASKYGEPPRIMRGAPAGSTYRALSDEHGRVDLPGGLTLPLDARVECVIPHCDPTVNLFDRLHVVRDDDLVAVWPVTGRGA